MEISTVTKPDVRIQLSHTEAVIVAKVLGKLSRPFMEKESLPEQYHNTTHELYSKLSNTVKKVMVAIHSVE